jgi:RimJ/RimL family protein N-acetyltransferase
MVQDNLSVRETEEKDIKSIVDYFLNSSDEFLLGLGVDKAKLPGRDEWLKMLSAGINKKIHDREFYFIIWLLNNEPAGHSNINKIIYGEEAYMHLHLWQSGSREKGLGSKFLKLCIPQYFEKFKLKNLFCEPYAENTAPNKTLEKLGFEFIKQYETIPGWINFRQPVNRWLMSFDRYRSLYRL